MLSSLMPSENKSNYRIVKDGNGIFSIQRYVHGEWCWDKLHLLAKHFHITTIEEARRLKQELENSENIEVVE